MTVVATLFGMFIGVSVLIFLAVYFWPESAEVDELEDELPESTPRVVVQQLTANEVVRALMISPGHLPLALNKLRRAVHAQAPLSIQPTPVRYADVEKKLASRRQGAQRRARDFERAS